MPAAWRRPFTMLQTRSVAKPEQNLHEYEKAHRPEIHLTCGLFVSFRFSVLRFFAPEPQSAAAGCFAVLGRCSRLRCTAALLLWLWFGFRLLRWHGRRRCFRYGLWLLRWHRCSRRFRHRLGGRKRPRSRRCIRNGLRRLGSAAVRCRLSLWPLPASVFSHAEQLPHDLIIAPGILAALQIIGQFVHHASAISCRFPCRLQRGICRTEQVLRQRAVGVHRLLLFLPATWQKQSPKSAWPDRSSPV